jgi:multicomponent Na+:H+ antiporter subunit B
VSRRGRLGVFAAGGGGLLVVLLLGLRGLPAFGHFHGAYGLLVDRIEPVARRATDIVTALNFDLRAFDTLGEEFILFASVTGVALLLRHLRDDDEVQTRPSLPDHRFAGPSDALRATSLLLIPLLTALGVYLALHGALTPGGGFQAGVVLAAGPLAILLAGRYLALRRLAPKWALEALESLGAIGYGAIGLAGLILTGIYLKNAFPLGTPDHLLSAGMMPLNSIAVGLEVTGAFLLIWTEFLDQDVIVERDEL